MELNLIFFTNVLPTQNLQDLFSQILEVDVTFNERWSNVSHVAMDFILRLLVKDPKVFHGDFISDSSHQ
jgi:hypothetical protein